MNQQQLDFKNSSFIAHPYAFQNEPIISFVFKELQTPNWNVIEANAFSIHQSEYAMYAHVRYTVKEKLPTIVKIDSIWLNVYQEDERYEGRGIMISPTIVVTCAHVAGARPSDPQTPSLPF